MLAQISLSEYPSFTLEVLKYLLLPAEAKSCQMAAAGFKDYVCILKKFGVFCSEFCLRQKKSIIPYQLIYGNSYFIVFNHKEDVWIHNI